jgi:hypothetical protein
LGFEVRARTVVPPKTLPEMRARWRFLLWQEWRRCKAQWAPAAGYFKLNRTP